MLDPGKGGDVYNAGEGNVAEFDNDSYGGSTRINDGHHTTYGNVDGEHYHRSYEKDGSRDHSTLNKDSDWHVNH